MGEFHEGMRNLATELIGFFGDYHTLTLTRKPDPAFDPLTGIETPGTPEVHQIACVTQARMSSTFEGILNDKDVPVIVPAKDIPIEPRPGDLIEIPGYVGQFIIQAGNFRKVAPDGEAIAYRFTGRLIGT